MRPGRIACWTAALLGLLGYGIFLAVSDAPPVRAYAHVDFYDYYFAADAIRRGVDPYDATAADARASAAGTPVIPGSDYIYPAWFAAGLIPLTFLSPRTAASVWFLLSGFVLLATLRTLLPAEWQRLAVAGALFPPTLFSLFVGQTNILIFALLAAGWSWRDERPERAGVALGLATAIKLSPVLLIGWGLWRGRWRLVLAAVGTGLCCLIAGEVMSPWSTVTYATRVLPSVAELAPRHAHPVNQSLGAALLRHLTANDWTHPLWNAPHLVRPLAILAGVTLLALIPWRMMQRLPGEKRDAAEWGALVCVMIIASPLAWEATFVLALLPLSLVLRFRGFSWSLAVAWGMVAGQRLLDDFANHPESHPILVAAPPLSSLAVFGVLLIYGLSLGGKDVNPAGGGRCRMMQVRRSRNRTVHRDAGSFPKRGRRGTTDVMEWLNSCGRVP